MRPSKDTPKRSASPKSWPALSELVIKRRGERGEQVAAALDVAANRVALRIRQRCGVGEDQQPVSIEMLRRQERLVREFEGYARFDQRLIHPHHVVAGAIAAGDARVVGLGLLGEEHARPAPAALHCAGSARCRNATGRCARPPATSGDRRARLRTWSPTAACRWPCLRPPTSESPARSGPSPSSDMALRARR